MTLLPVEKAPEWLKLNPVTGVYYVKIYRASCHPKGLCRSTKERGKLRAIAIGERMIARWIGKDPTTGALPGYLFSECCDEYLKHMEERLKNEKIKASTLGNARIIVPVLREDLGMMDVNQIGFSDWEAWDRAYRKRSGSKTVYNYWKHMGMVMEYAIRKEWRLKPWSVECSDPESEGGRRATESEKSAILRAAADYPDLLDQLIFAMTTGMRKSEILRQSFDRSKSCGCLSDLDARTVSICRKHAKTKNSCRTFKMPDQVYAMLLKRFELSQKRLVGKSHYVFPSPGDPESPVGSNKNAWTTVKRLAGIRGRLRFHDLRHTFLSEAAGLVKKGMIGVAQVCEFAGLTITVFNRVYLHMDENDTAEVANLVRVNLGSQTSITEVTH